MLPILEHYFAAKSLYNKQMTPVCKAYGLTQMELTILLFLANNPDCNTASQIVKCRNLTKSHVSISVKSLQEKGLLSCFYETGDRKTVRLRLSGETAGIVADGRAAQEAFGRALLRGFSQEETALLQSFLERIRKNMSVGE